MARVSEKVGKSEKNVGKSEKCRKSRKKSPSAEKLRVDALGVRKRGLQEKGRRMECSHVNYTVNMSTTTSEIVDDVLHSGWRSLRKGRIARESGG